MLKEGHIYEKIPVIFRSHHIEKVSDHFYLPVIN